MSEDTKFRSVDVQLLNLNEWANRLPWAHGVDQGQSAIESVTFTAPEIVTVELPDATALLWRSWSEHEQRLSSVMMQSDEWVRFDFGEPIDLASVEHNYVRTLANLMELVAATRTETLGLRLVAADASEYAPPVTFLSAITRGEPPKPRQWFQVLLMRKDVSFEELLPAWWQLHEDVGIVCDLLSTLKERGYVSNHFLSAASAIEAYHRNRYNKLKPSEEHQTRLQRLRQGLAPGDLTWLNEKLAHSHEPTFANRIDELVAEAGPLFASTVGDLEKWRKWVKDGRNSVAHRDPTMVDIDKEWRTTVRITPTIDWLLRLVLLRDLGVTEDVIQAGVQREGSLQVVRENLRTVKPEWFSDQ